MRLAAVRARVIRWPIEPRGAARGAWGERAAVIVAVTTDGGATGLGEAAPLTGMSTPGDNIETALAAIAELAARAAAGSVGLDSPGHVARVAERVAAHAPAARFAIETALYAALAQHARTSIAALLAPLPVAELAVAEVVDDEAAALYAAIRGVRYLKLKAASPDVVHRVHQAAPHARLRVDANRRWPRADVLRWLAELAPLPIDFVEEPCEGAVDLLGEALPCRLALDESLVELDTAALDRALASPDLAALVLKPTLLGGFTRCLELAGRAHRAGVAPIASHALEGPIGTAACVELARAIGADVPVGLGPHPATEQFWAHV